jgi:hypothetical protein
MPWWYITLLVLGALCTLHALNRFRIFFWYGSVMPSIARQALKAAGYHIENAVVDVRGQRLWWHFHPYSLEVVLIDTGRQNDSRRWRLYLQNESGERKLLSTKLFEEQVHECRVKAHRAFDNQLDTADL